MGKGSKKLYWAGAGAAFLLILLIAAAVFVPRVIDSAWLKETIRTEAAKQVNGELDFQKVELSILPSPYIALHQISLNIPDTAQIELDTIRVYPKLLPLLIGNVELNEVVIEKPDFTLPLPDKKRNKMQEGEPLSLSEVLDNASSKLAPALAAIQGLDVGVHQGTLRLFSGNQQVFLFENIKGEFHADTKSLTTSISSSSNIWKSMGLKAQFTPGSKAGKGKISFRDFNGKVLTDYFLDEQSSPLGGTFSHLQADFTIDPKSGFKAAIQSTGSTFTALNNDKEITAIIDNLKGNIHYTDQQSSIVVEDLTLSSPQVELSGSFKLDNTIPHTSLDIKAQNSDIASIREVLPVFITSLFGDLPIVQEIFNITRAGTITQATFHVEGKSLSDLAEFESMLIQGHIENSEIFLSDLGLDLQEVTGHVTIAQGILEGNNVIARLGNTTGKNGTLKLGLGKKDTTPFHLDLDIIADLSEVPPLLKQLLQDENTQRYLSLFENSAGRSYGRLTMGESLESLAVRVAVNRINAQFKLEPVPYLITIDGGSFIIDGLKTESHNLQGKIGKSTFSNYSSVLNFEGEPAIVVQSGTFHLVLDEIFPWLTSYGKLADDLKNIRNISGITDITVKSIKGSLLKPSSLQYEVEGSLKDLILETTKLPGPLNIKSGQTKIVPNKITFIDLQANLLDSSLTYSGILQDYIDGKTNAEVIVTDATIGDELNTWFVENVNVPKQYQFKTPLLISRARAKWTRNELFDIQADFSIKNGPILSVDIMLNPEELRLRNLSIKNGEDQAFIKLDLKKRMIGAEFKGSLSKNTIDKILLYRDVDHNAWIKGDISLFINMDSFAESTASGSLDGGDFIVPLKHDKHLLLDSYSLSATDKTLTLNSAEAVLGDQDFSINGAVSLSQDLVSLDLDVKTDSIEPEKILKALQEGEKEETEGEEQRVGKSWDLALHSNIKFNADSLLYNGYTWKPIEVLITYQNSFFGIEVLKAELCNISTPGEITFHEGKISLDLQMETSGQELNEVLICLDGGEQQMTGTLDLKANISGQGTKDTLVNSLHGNLQFSAKDGFIYQDARAAKLLYFLNVSNMFRGKIPDLKTTGFHYDYLVVRGVMENGVLEISPAKLEAPIMEIVSHGAIDIPRKKIYLQILVAPLQTLNKIQKMLPIISKIIPSSLVALPVEMRGDFSDIKVEAMSMSAISNRVIGVMVDALSTPVRVIEESSEEAK